MVLDDRVRLPRRGRPVRRRDEENEEKEGDMDEILVPKRVRRIYVGA
jgi:hypothetical protein